MTSKKLSITVCTLLLAIVGVFVGVHPGTLVGVQPRQVPIVHAACSSLGLANFVWNIHNVPHEATGSGEPGARLQWDVSGTNFVGALVKAKYETTEGNAIWYCAKITGLNAFANCANPMVDPPFPNTVFAVAGVHNDPSTNPCPTATSDGAPCTAEIKYTLTFKPTDGTGRTLAETYYWPDNSALPTAHDFGDCGEGQVYRYANFGPIYGNCSNNPQNNCYTVLFEEAP